MNAICEDEIEEMESDRKPAADDIVDDDNEPEVQPMEIDGDEADVFSYLEAVENVLKLQKSAHKLGVNEAATVHLDRYLKALHSSNATKARRDTTLHEHFPPAK
jgi:hypothetical protein